jgi:magnesium chelatase family protein
VHAARTLLEIFSALENGTLLTAVAADPLPVSIPHLRDVRGQLHARRALEVAAASGHHLLLLGTPGCGKTLLASRLRSILPAAQA